jgi:hypothetical protein
MPLAEEMRTVLPLVSELPERQQREIAESISRYVVAYDYAQTMTLEQIVKLTQLVLDDVSRTIDELKR